MPTRPTSGAARDASAGLRCLRWPRTRSRRLPDSPAGLPGCAPAATRGHTGAPTPATGTLPAPRQAAHQAHATSIGWARIASRAPARTTAHPPAAASASGTTATALGRSGSPADHKAGQHPPRQIRRIGYRCRVNRTTGAREPDNQRRQTELKVRRRSVSLPRPRSRRSVRDFVRRGHGGRGCRGGQDSAAVRRKASRALNELLTTALDSEVTVTLPAPDS